MQTIGTTFDMMAHTADHFDVRTTNDASQVSLEKLAGVGQCSVVGDVEELVRAFEMSEHLVDSEPVVNVSRQRRQQSWHASYHTFKESIEWYEDIASEFESITKFVPRVATSHGGLAISALHIVGTGPGEKKKMWFQCGIRAREWISPAVCMYIVDHFVNGYRVDAEVTALLDSVELIVIPFVNPDGYEYTWTNSRLWRKNRQPNSGSSCVGTDLNRNYDEHWGEGGGSTSPCSETYQGARAWSAPEAEVLAEYYSANAPIYGAIDWHAYSQLVLRPWGWTTADAPDEPKLKECGDLFRDEVGKVFGTTFVSQKSMQLYRTTGTANDWFYGDDASRANQGLRAYGFTIELRDTGRYGFELPASQIIPSGQEMIPAAMSFLSFCRDNELPFRSA